MTTCNHSNRHAILAVKRLEQSKLELNTQELNTQELSKQEPEPEHSRSSPGQRFRSNLMLGPGYKTTQLEQKSILGLMNRPVTN